MRSLLLSLAFLAALAPGTALAQSRGYARPNYYTPSSYGTPNGSLYTPSNIGMSRYSYGMPNPSLLQPFPAGPLTPATPIPTYALNSPGVTPLPSNAAAPVTSFYQAGGNYVRTTVTETYAPPPDSPFAPTPWYNGGPSTATDSRLVPTFGTAPRYGSRYYGPSLQLTTVPVTPGGLYGPAVP